MRLSIVSVAAPSSNTCTRSPAARKKKPCSIEAISHSHGCVAGAQAIHYKRDARNREGRSRSGPDQNQQAHGYSQRIGLEHKARLRSSRSEGAHQLPLLLLSSLSRDVSPTRSHAKQVPRSCEASVAQCLYPASFRVSLETSQQDESIQRRARFRSLRQQLREETSKRRHIANATCTNDRLRPRHRYTHPPWPDPPLLIMSPCAAVAGCLKAATNRFGSAELCMAWRRDKDLLQTSLAEYMRRHTVRAIAEAKRAHPKRTISPGPECGTRDGGVGVDQQSGGSGLQFSPLRLAVAPNFDTCPVQPDP